MCGRDQCAPGDLEAWRTHPEAAPSLLADLRAHVFGADRERLACAVGGGRRSGHQVPGARGPRHGQHLRAGRAPGGSCSARCRRGRRKRRSSSCRRRDTAAGRRRRPRAPLRRARTFLQRHDLPLRREGQPDRGGGVEVGERGAPDGEDAGVVRQRDGVESAPATSVLPTVWETITNWSTARADRRETDGCTRRRRARPVHPYGHLQRSDSRAETPSRRRMDSPRLFTPRIPRDITFASSSRGPRRPSGSNLRAACRRTQSGSPRARWLFMGWLADRGGMRTGFLMPLVLFALLALYGAAWPRLENPGRSRPRASDPF
jgi:hypothetical protein